MANYSMVNATLQHLVSDIKDSRETYDECLDTLWTMIASMLVIFMHSGFSLLEAGCVRWKNAQNILAKNLIVVTLGFLCWYVFGYAIAFGEVESPNRFMSGSNFLMVDLWNDKSKFKVWFFQGTFCATGGTIVSGAMAERTKLRGFGTFTVLMTSLIYPIVAYWAWSGSGWLKYKEDGEDVSTIGPAFIDFAGSGVVHLVGGVSALVGAIAVGPRKDRWNPEHSESFEAHSVPFCVLGTFFLWFGWYGFNPGSTGSMHNKETAFTAAVVAVNTTLAPCVAGLLVFFLRARVVAPKALDVGGFCNGILAGLVSITAGCATVKPWEAIIIGLIGGSLYQVASMLVQRFQVDDVVDAFAVHGAGGAWALIAVGFFGNPDAGIGGNGVLYGGDQLGVQLIGLFVIFLWSGALATLIFTCLRKLGLLRLSDNFQDKGADHMEHAPSRAYNDSSA